MGPEKRRRGESFGPTYAEARAQSEADLQRLRDQIFAPGGITGPSLYASTPPAPAMGEFDAPEFSIEPVTGARAFEVDKLGRLTGVTYKAIWTPGENTHQCMAPMESMTYYIRAMSASLYGGPEPTPEPSGREPHSIVGCKCGMYGYYDGSNDYGKAARVSGVIEGYGEVVIGTRGFRATKARIVALTIEPEVPGHLAAKVRHNYRDIPFYESFAQMVTAHPCDHTRGITPESDPDFWTRAI